MRARSTTVSLAFGFAAAAAAAALLAWVFGLQGSIGLFRWEPYYRRIFLALGAAGAIPPALAALAALAGRGGPGLGARAGAAARRTPRILAAAAIGLASLSLITDAGLFAALRAKAGSMSGPAPAV